MAFNKETAIQVESLYRGLPEEAFQGTFTFDPITVELTQNMFDQDAFHVTAVYNGDGRLLDPVKLNRISSLMIDRATELGIENTIIESYADSREYAGQVDRAEEPLEEISGNQDWHKMLNIARRFLNTGNLPNEAELSHWASTVATSPCTTPSATATAVLWRVDPGNGDAKTGPGSTWAWTKAPSRRGYATTGPKPPMR